MPSSKHFCRRPPPPHASAVLVKVALVYFLEMGSGIKIGPPPSLLCTQNNGSNAYLNRLKKSNFKQIGKFSFLKDFFQFA